MGRRKFAVGAMVAVAVVVVPGVALAAHQKWTVSLTGSCKDLRMDEAKDDDDCEITATVAPKTPARTVTLQIKAGSSWSKVKTTKTKGGSVSFAISAYDDEESWRDGTVRYRLSVSKSGKEKAFTSKQYAIEFTPDSGDESGDDSSDDESSTVTAAPKSPTPTTPTHGGTPTTTAPKATTPTTPTHGGSTATTTTVAAAPNGGTPTNTAAPGGEDPNWFGGANPTSLGAFCTAGDPTMYVGATICNSISGRKTVTQFKELIAPISNAAPQYKRNGFCTQAMYAVGGLSVTQVNAKCTEANAGR